MRLITWMNIIPGTHYIVLSLSQVNGEFLISEEELKKNLVEPAQAGGEK